MEIGGSNLVGISSSVWTATTRTLTAFGTTALVLTGNSQTTLAANGTLDLRPAVNIFMQLQIAATAGAAGTTVINMNDGTHIIPMLSIASSTSGTFTALGNSVQGPQMKNNDAANPTTYISSGVYWHNA